MIEIKDVNGKWRKIKPLDKGELNDLSPDEFFGQESNGDPKKGFPWYFDQVGDSILLYFAPTSTAVTLASGFRVSFKRTADLFITTDTTQEPGLPSSHHSLLAYMASISYCMKYHKDRVPWIERKVGSADSRNPLYGGMKKSLIAHYAIRERAKRKQMTMAPIRFR